MCDASGAFHFFEVHCRPGPWSTLIHALRMRSTVITPILIIGIVLVFGFSTAISLVVGREFSLRDFWLQNFGLGGHASTLKLFHNANLSVWKVILENCIMESSMYL